MANRADIFSFLRGNFHKHRLAVLAKIDLWFYTIVDRFRKVLFGFYFVTELRGLGFTALAKF